MKKKWSVNEDFYNFIPKNNIHREMKEKNIHEWNTSSIFKWKPGPEEFHWAVLLSPFDILWNMLCWHSMKSITLKMNGQTNWVQNKRRVAFHRAGSMQTGLCKKWIHGCNFILLKLFANKVCSYIKKKWVSLN